MSNYPPGAEHDPNAPWNARDNETCPECDSFTCTYLLATDDISEEWECDECGLIWSVQTGPDPDDLRDRMRDDNMTGDS